MSTRQFLALLRAAEKRAALLRAAARSPAALLLPCQDMGRGVPAVHVRCGACGTPAATVERHGGALRVRAGETLLRLPHMGYGYAELPKLAALGVMRPHISHRFPMDRAADESRSLNLGDM